TTGRVDGVRRDKCVRVRGLNNLHGLVPAAAANDGHHDRHRTLRATTLHRRKPEAVVLERIEQFLLLVAGDDADQHMARANPPLDGHAADGARGKSGGETEHIPEVVYLRENETGGREPDERL